ncbi:hypothetical protein C0J50_18485 [Silurus asotus]|uniref:Uncharacterized protein n=1 Tax=Silurus asotus TaxID=30991 RepID=A0AAD5ATE3_SILAS|nr:hypothetical protein C0J50_18485 [Silurus asotus]
MAENELKTIPDQSEDEDKSRGEGEGEEKVRAEEDENVLALKSDQLQEDSECQVPASKTKPGRVQSVFCLVRDQIRGQPVHEANRMGMLQLVQQVTRQLDRTKMGNGSTEDTLPRTDLQETLEVQEETSENEQTNEECKKDECVVILQQILNSIEGLRKDLVEELNLLRQESQTNTDRVLRELETRLTPSQQINADTNAPVSIPPLAGAPKRRILRRTLTTVAPKTSQPQAFRPRCMSEPVGSRNKEIVSNGNGTLPVSTLDPLLPSLVVTHHAKKPVHSKPRVNKPAA